MSNVIDFPAWKAIGGYTTCRIIAEETGLTHKWIRTAIRKNIVQIEHSDPLRIVNGEYVLTIGQTWLFVGFLRKRSTWKYKFKVTTDFCDRIDKAEAEMQKYDPDYSFYKTAFKEFFGVEVFQQIN